MLLIFICIFLLCCHLLSIPVTGRRRCALATKTRVPFLGSQVDVEATNTGIITLFSPCTNSCSCGSSHYFSCKHLALNCSLATSTQPVPDVLRVGCRAAA
ncbi:hypothetical protein L208DRAFT_277596 [Tricholoma matsutake]|nr:hypothetical protein L208DRAFT_277596 [Tricholoma matsutake 945]